MNPTSIARTDAAPPRPIRQRQEQLESRMWERARRNLMLLYNGGRSDEDAARVVAPATLVGPLAVPNPEF